MHWLELTLATAYLAHLQNRSEFQVPRIALDWHDLVWKYHFRVSPSTRREHMTRASKEILARARAMQNPLDTPLK